MFPARFGEQIGGGKVRCRLCPHRCVISDGRSGICGARKNIAGDLYSLNYGVVSGIAVDTIEKKPLYHYYPGKRILSIGTFGCNLRCPFCQNWTLSRFYDENHIIPESDITPNDVLSLARREGDFGGVAYTYSEPMVWFEFVNDCAKLIRDNGLKNVFVTNGYIEPEPLSELLPLMDAANVDIKAFRDQNYRQLGGTLQPVLDTITAMKKAGVHVELTTLVVTGLNDDLEELSSIVDWVAAIDPSIPLHFSRYFPQYRWHEHATDIALLDKTVELARKKLHYVYTGNIAAESDTFCPDCASVLVERKNGGVRTVGIRDGKCVSCGRATEVVVD
jgi:pyruvate formate lyase activating enzyme